MTNSKLARKFISVILAFALVFSTVAPAVAEIQVPAGIVSITDFVGGSGGNDSTITTGNVPINGWKNTIWFGKSGGNAIQWRVLEQNTKIVDPSDPSKTKTTGIFLLSDKILYNQEFDSSSSIWGDGTSSSSAIRTQMNGTGDGQFLNSSNFGTAEYNAIAQTSLNTPKGSTDHKTTDRVFLLTKDDVTNSAYGFSDDNSRKSTGGSYSNFWLRSPYGNYAKFAFFVYPAGSVGFDDVDFWDGVRPALNLNQESVLFLSAAVGGSGTRKQGKEGVGVGDGFNINTNYDGSDGWKLTLKNCDSIVKKPTLGALTLDATSDSKWKYSGASTGTNMYISALLEQNGKYVNYAKFANTSSSATGEMTIGTSTTDGSYTMYIYGEQANGDCETDYASTLSSGIPVTFSGGKFTGMTLGSAYTAATNDVTLKNGFALTLDNATYNQTFTVDTGGATINTNGATFAGNVTLKANTTFNGNVTLGTSNTFNMVNSTANTATVNGTFNANNQSVKLDVIIDSTASSDKITATSITNLWGDSWDLDTLVSNGSLNIVKTADLDTTQKKQDVQVLDVTGLATAFSGKYKVDKGEPLSKKYVITQALNADGTIKYGWLQIKKLGITLRMIVQGKDPDDGVDIWEETEAELDGNLNLDNWLEDEETYETAHPGVLSKSIGTLAHQTGHEKEARSLTINGNGYTLTAGSQSGITIEGTSDEVTFKNITFDGFTTAIDNSGIINLADSTNAVTFTNGTTQDIINNGTMKVLGQVNLSAGITGTGTVNVAGKWNLTTSGQPDTAITQKSLTISSGSLTANAGQLVITDGITNNVAGGLILTGGTLEESISGSGTTKFTTATTTMSGELQQNATVADSSAGLTILADNLKAIISNSGNVTLSGGTLASGMKITGSTITIGGDVIVTSAADLAGTVTNVNKTLTLKGGELGGNITNAGTTVIDGTVSSAKSIANAVTINAEKELTNTGEISGTVTNKGTLTSTASNIKNTVINDGTWNMTTTDTDAIKYAISTSGTDNDNKGTLNISSKRMAVDAMVSNQKINLTGQLLVDDSTRSGYLDATNKNDLTLASSGILNMRSTGSAEEPVEINSITVGNFVGDSGQLYFDAKYNAPTVEGQIGTLEVDTIKADKASGTIKLGSVKINTPETTDEWELEKSIDITLVDATTFDNFKIDGTVTATTNGFRYDFEQSAQNTGGLKATKYEYSGTLIDIVNNKTVTETTGDYESGNINTYQLTDSLTASKDGKIGTLTNVDGKGPRAFTIEGEGYTMTATTAGDSGISTDTTNGGTVTLKNLTMKNYGTALTLATGTTGTLINTTFTGTTGDVANVVNDGTLKLNGENSSNIISFDKGIKDRDGNASAGETDVNVSTKLADGVYIYQKDIKIASDATLSVQADLIKGQVTSENDGEIILRKGTGTGTLNLGTNAEGNANTISGGKITIDGDVSAAITSLLSEKGITTNESATLTLTGSGDLADDISGSGTTKITDAVTNNNDKTITQNSLEIGTDASLTTNADCLEIASGITNNVASGLILTGGTLKSTVSGDGSIKIADTDDYETSQVKVIIAADVTQPITVGTNSSLWANATYLKDIVTNESEHSVHLYSDADGDSVINHDIKGAGLTTIEYGTTQNLAKVENKLYVTEKANFINGSEDTSDASGTAGTVSKTVENYGYFVNTANGTVSGDFTNYGVVNMCGTFGGEIDNTVSDTSLLYFDKGQTTLTGAKSLGGNLCINLANYTDGDVIVTTTNTLDVSGIKAISLLQDDDTQVLIGNEKITLIDHATGFGHARTNPYRVAAQKPDQTLTIYKYNVYEENSALMISGYESLEINPRANSLLEAHSAGAHAIAGANNAISDAMDSLGELTGEDDMMDMQGEFENDVDSIGSQGETGEHDSVMNGEGESNEGKGTGDGQGKSTWQGGEHKYKWAPFFTIQANRRTSGDTYDLESNTVSVVAGITKRLDEHGRIAIFANGGTGSYKTTNPFVGSADGVVTAKGDTNYFGGGIYARYEATKTRSGYFYADASVSAGYTTQDYSTNDFRDSLYKCIEYVTGAMYVNGYTTIGYNFRLDAHSHLEAYVKYMHGVVGGDRVYISLEDVDFGSTTSSRLRFGLRYIKRLRDNESGGWVRAYLGVAYEYEFDARSSANAGYTGESSRGIFSGTDDGGGSAMLELGLNFTPSEDSRWKFDFALQGFWGHTKSIGIKATTTYETDN